MAPWRLIIGGRQTGFVNMAMDEAIAAAVASGAQPPTLRLYGWEPPAVSLGYHQPPDEGIDHDAVRERGYHVVRRPTGGRAILHADELTYSFCIRQDAIEGGHSVMQSYRVISRGIVTGLELLGAEVSLGDDDDRGADGDTDHDELHAGAGADHDEPDADAARPICFAKTARCDLQSAGRKVVGSAQVRRDGGILQHGSIPITIDLEDQIAVMPGADERIASRVLAGAAMSVTDLLGRPVTYEELSEAVVEGFAQAFERELMQAELSEDERAEADRLHDEKYATAAWNERAPSRG